MKSSIHFIEGLNETQVNVSPEALKQAKETLGSSSLPTTRDEAWKYTRVAKINKIGFRNEEATIQNIDQYLVDPDAHTLVFINGYLSEEHSSNGAIEGVEIKSLTNSEVASNLPLTNKVFNAVNTLFLNDGVEITIANKQIVDKTIQIIHVLSGNEVISNFKTIIKAGDFSQAAIVQGFFADGECSDSFTNATTEVEVGVNTNLTIDKIQAESEKTYHINSELVKQDKDSTFTINTITLNGMLVRNNLNIEVNGQNCTSNLYGAYLLKNKQHIDNHTVVDHKVAHCDSNELYKGVIDDNSTAVFNGKVFVRQDAQKINAFQSNGNVLLSDNASVNSKPELEIYADDVKCSHGSTTGQLDEEAVFYLRARGISERSARKLLVAAFIQDVLDNIENEAVLNYINGLLEERFDWIS